MEAVTIQKFIHTTPRKLRLVADMVRDLEPNKAVETLRFTPKMAAVDLGKAIKTAVANARGKGMEEVIFKSLEINEGSKMKRFQAGTRGRAKPYARRMAHIKIVLTDEVSKVEKVSKVPQVKATVTLSEVAAPAEEKVVENEVVLDNQVAKPAKKEKK